MKILSLFDGISCARVALERAGIPVEVYYASEIDRYAQTVSEKNYPDIIRIGDVRGITKDMVGEIDLLVGGSPCQDLSIAKHERKGLSGERSGLFWEYVRILNEVKPKYFILENVFSMSKESKQIITDALGVQPIMIDATLVSAQRRKRLFWTNIPGIVLPEDRGIFLKDIIENDVDEKYYISEATLQTILEKMNQGKPLAQAFRIHGIDGKSVTLSSGGGGTGAKTGLYFMAPNGSEQHKSLAITASYHKKNLENYLMKSDGQMVFVVPESTRLGFSIAEDGDAIDLSYPSSQTRRGRVGDKVKNLMATKNMNVFTGCRVRKLTPIECERLQGLPDNYTSGISNTQRYCCTGNAFNVDVITHILKSINEDNR